MEAQNSLTSKHARWISPVYYLLAFYVLGAGMMDSFAMYHTWWFVGPDEFVRMHIESGGRIVKVFVLPTLVMTIFLVLQLWHRPKVVPRYWVWIGIICTIIPWLSSAFIQIPMQIKLDNGKNTELLHELIVTDWIRVVPTVGLAIVTFLMIRQLVSYQDRTV